MMKRIFAVLFCALLIWLLAACARSVKPGVSAPSDTGAEVMPSGELTPSGVLSASKHVDQDFDTSGNVVVAMEYAVYGSDVPLVSFTITNNTSAGLTYGADFEIEVSKNSTWYEVPFPENTMWISIAYLLDAHSERSGSFAFSVFNYKLSSGNYRLIKEIGGKLYHAEFQIGKSPITAETPFGYQPLEKLPKDYSSEAAAENGDMVITIKDIKNAGKLADFIGKAAIGMPAMLRVVQYTDEGNPIITDFIYNDKQNGYYLYRFDNSRDKFGAAVGITQVIYSYLVTDGAGLYLSNSAGWDQTKKYIREDAAQIPWRESFAGKAEMIETVQHMTEKRLEGSVIRYKAFSPDGDKAIDLTDEKLAYGYETQGGGEIRYISDPDKIATEIKDVFWLDDQSAVLVCDTTGNLKYYNVVGGAGSSGYGTGYTVTNGVFEIVK